MIKVCGVDGCLKPVKARGFCGAHYMSLHRKNSGEFKTRKRGAVLDYINSVIREGGTDECVQWPFATVKGYGRVSIDGRLMIASRVVCEMAHGAPPSGKHQAAHTCGKGHIGCINPRHIRWASPSQNQMDRHDHGTALAGEHALGSKLSDADVLEIRAYDGGNLKSFAARFPVSYQQVCAIRSGKYWKHVGQPLDSVDH